MHTIGKNPMAEVIESKKVFARRFETGTSISIAAMRAQRGLPCKEEDPIETGKMILSITDLETIWDSDDEEWVVEFPDGGPAPKSMSVVRRSLSNMRFGSRAALRRLRKTSRAKAMS